MAKVAFLVLGHASPEILSVVTRLFNFEQFEFFVHVDQKVDARSYQNGHEFFRTTFVEEREEIFWGGFNMVKATLNLINAANKADPAFFCLISDNSFPLVKPSTFYESLQSRPLWMDCFQAGSDRLRRYNDYYHFDSNHTSARWLPTESRKISREDLLVYGRVNELMTRGKRPVSLFCGSQWWILSKEVIASILDLLDRDPWLAESFAFSAIPDEHFFQTIAMECALSKSPPSKKLIGPMFVDFSKDPKPFVFFSKDQIDERSLGEQMFIRKVQYNEALIDWLIDRRK